MITITINTSVIIHSMDRENRKENHIVTDKTELGGHAPILQLGFECREIKSSRRFHVLYIPAPGMYHIL